MIGGVLTAVCRNIEVSVGSNCLATVTPAQVDGGSDDPDGTDPENELTMSISPEGPFAPGVDEVTLTVTDADDESDECVATVTVVDDTDPTISGVGPDMTIGCPGTPVFSTPTVSDNCSATMGYTDAMTDLCGNSYSITRTWTATDASNNTATADQMITLTDASDPTINLTTAVGRLWPANHHYNTVTVASIVASISENCDTDLSKSNVVITKCTSDEPEDANGNGDGNTDTDMLIANNCKSVDLRAERSGNGNGRVYRIWLQLTDACGNTTSTSYKVGVPHSNNSTAVEGAAVYTEYSNCDALGKRAATTAGSRQDWYSSRTFRIRSRARPRSPTRLPRPAMHALACMPTTARSWASSSMQHTMRERMRRRSTERSSHRVPTTTSSSRMARSRFRA